MFKPAELHAQIVSGDGGRIEGRHEARMERILRGIQGELFRIFWKRYSYLQDAVDDFNMGTLMRLEATKCYSDENTIVVPRVCVSPLL